MKRIAILRCLRSNDVCTGAGCLAALQRRAGAFARYDEEALQLVAFCSCNGCQDALLENQAGLREKLEMLQALEPDAVHIGVCARRRDESGRLVLCGKIKAMALVLKQQGIAIVVGTH